MKLTEDEQWILAYISSRAQSWGDVRDDGIRAMKRIKDHRDFLDWISYFLPESRQEEAKKALLNYKTARARKTKTTASVKRAVKQVPITMDERAARLLVNGARAENCSISEFLLKRLTG